MAASPSPPPLWPLLASSEPSTVAQRLSLVQLDARMQRLVDPLVAARAGAPTASPPSRGVIIALFANAGFLPFLKNLLCGMDRVGVTNHLVLAFDNQTCPRLSQPFGLRGSTTCTFPYSHKPLTETGIARYRSLEFNRMVMQRPLWVLHWLRSGYEVLQVDLDVSWLADPQPLFRSARYAAHDLLFQSEGGHGFNAGFYLARPKRGAVTVLSAWTADLMRQAESKAFEEQHSLGRSLSRHNRSVPLLVEKLNTSEFPNGKIWWQYREPKSKRDTYVVHCNWVKSNKKGRLVRDNLWALDAEDSQCAAEWDPLAEGCVRYCRPFRYCAPAVRCVPEACATLVRDGWHAMALREGGCNSSSYPRSKRADGS
ncbi:hypothetical protein AB1Y20_013370 [Prymnesium parvum]|uniref:Nucleotide-diphospho-sugar transferase domain-containing protein n=1 Tax=Prymnesium parvum TaxID=97485 RepID=A0AB34IFE5_PRYPA